MADNPVEYFSKMQANPGWRAILESFARFIAPTAGWQALDVGCGPGALVAVLQQDYQLKAFGVDADPMMAQQAAANHGNRFTAGSLPHLPYAENTFDLITATNVIYLVDDPAAALRDIGRVLKSGGMFVMLNPSEKMNIAAATALADERGLTDFARENFIHWGEVAERKPRWSEKDIAALFLQAGLTLIETRERIGDGLARYARGIKR